MPVTTILEHRRERERLAQPDSDTPMSDHDHDQGPSMQEQMQEVRLLWALALEEHLQVSLLTEKKKAAAVAARSNPPDSRYSVEILNRPFNPDSSKPSARPTGQRSSGMYKTSQAGGRNLGPPQGVSLGSLTTGRSPPTNHMSGPEACKMQQHDPQQYSSPAHGYGRISPDICNVAHRAVNALWAHKRGETASGDNNARQAGSSPRIIEQCVTRAYNSPYTPPASQSSTQTSPLEFNGRQASNADYHTGNPSPVEWDAVRAYPTAPDAIVSKITPRFSGRLLT
ncbi:hypothetical protein HDV57DRAFT_86404 [Trichoderma longibrachiatum]